MADDKQNESRGGDVVRDRRVSLRAMTSAERAVARGEAPDVSETYPDAPKPKPRNDYRPQLKQLKRRHKRHERNKPAFMSDVKI